MLGCAVLNPAPFFFFRMVGQRQSRGVAQLVVRSALSVSFKAALFLCRGVGVWRSW